MPRMILKRTGDRPIIADLHYEAQMFVERHESGRPGKRYHHQFTLTLYETQNRRQWAWGLAYDTNSRGGHEYRWAGLSSATEAARAILAIDPTEQVKGYPQGVKKWESKQARLMMRIDDMYKKLTGRALAKLAEAEPGFAETMEQPS